MRLHYVVPFALLACGTNNGDTPTVDTGPPPPNFEFKQSVPVAAFEANIAQNVIDAHQMTNMLIASMGVVSADSAVQDLYNSDGDGGLRGVLSCWDRPQFPRWSFRMNFGTKSCEQFGMDGAVSVEDHPAGVLLFDFSNFKIGGREMGGGFALDRTGANPEPLFWSAYDTDGTDPGPDSRVQLGITLDAVPKGLTYDGGANINFLQRTFSMWGEATISGDPPITVVHGAAEPGIVSADDPPGADVLSLPLDWTQCRCAVSGISSLDMPLEISEITIDIDDMEINEDGYDDVTITVPVQEVIPGRAVLSHLSKCGTYDVNFELAKGASSTIQVDTQQLFARATFLCDTLTINDPERCQALYRGITALGDTVDVEFSDEDLNTTATNAVANEFDVNWCRIY